MCSCLGKGWWKQQQKKVKGSGAGRAKTRGRRGQNAGVSLSLGFHRAQWKSSLFLFQPALTIADKAFLAGWSVSVVLTSMRQCWSMRIHRQHGFAVQLLHTPCAAVTLKGYFSEQSQLSCRLVGFNDRNPLDDCYCWAHDMVETVCWSCLIAEDLVTAERLCVSVAIADTLLSRHLVPQQPRCFLWPGAHVLLVCGFLMCPDLGQVVGVL